MQLTAFSVIAVTLPVLNLGWRGDLVFRSVVLAVVAAGAAGFWAILARTRPSGQKSRFAVYACAVAATQGSPIVSGAYDLFDPVPGRPDATTARDVALDLAFGCLSLWAFLLVRSWVSRGSVREHLPRKPAPSLVARFTAPAAAAFLTMTVDRSSNGLIPAFQSWLGATWADDTQPSSGDSVAWAAEVGQMSLAGLVEEPVFTGIAMLLFPLFPSTRWRLAPFLKVAAVTSFARTLIHVYYASGQPHSAATLLALFVWCSVWSSATLAILYWSKSLVPVVVGHGLSDVMVTELSKGWDRSAPWAVLIQYAEIAVLLWSFAGAFVYWIVWLRRSSARARNSKQVKSTSVIAVQAESGSCDVPQ